eukprot:TRINITY_DN2483_c0_g2_i1.p1 TRINITY_DN2483_c0_g2~~TRINITY_DN2483_c0_g2_i1.p1  ORF type:complete len:199 (-),score=80.15 TRINITY_DN2483_c0_g2_i1:409-1005(-)
MPRRKAEEALYERLEAVSEQMTPQPPKAPKANPYHYFSDKIRPKLVEQDTPNDQIFAKIAELWNGDASVKAKYEKRFYNAWMNYYLETAKWIEDHPEEAMRIVEDERRTNFEYSDKSSNKKRRGKSNSSNANNNNAMFAMSSKKNNLDDQEELVHLHHHPSQMPLQHHQITALHPHQHPNLSVMHQMGVVPVIMQHHQ